MDRIPGMSVTGLDETKRGSVNGVDLTGRGLVIGVDEAGRGPVIGPLVISAVLTDDQEGLAGLGVKDSKMLTPERREELARSIRRSCTVETVMISAREIDDLRRQITLNRIEVNGFSLAIRKLVSHIGQEATPTIILDAADVNAERFGRDIEETLLTQLGSVPRVISEHKADERYAAVSAASIIAKVARDEQISAYRSKYGEVGSGYPSDPVTQRYLKEILNAGKPIPPIVRHSWETFKRMKEEASRTSLDDYL
jgi:ribonuclease HII